MPMNHSRRSSQPGATCAHVSRLSLRYVSRSMSKAHQIWTAGDKGPPGVPLSSVEPTGTVERSTAFDAVFQPVQPPTTFEETVERLGTAIRLGILAPGTRLPPERDLADELRISRSTLRQALTTLVQSGHLVSVRGRAGATFVAERPPLGQDAGHEPLGDHARSVLDYRVAVETGATTLAAERATPEDLDRLVALTEAMENATGPFDEYRRGGGGGVLPGGGAAPCPRAGGARRRGPAG